MSQHGPLPYVHFAGVEVANAARTLEYLRNGLGNTCDGHWDIESDTLCDVLYHALNGTPLTYVSPSADPAPWYDAAEPGAADFLGVVLLDMRGWDSTIARTVAQKPTVFGGGYPLGVQHKPRDWSFRAALISASDAGAEYGLRWLTDALSGGACAPCDSGTLLTRLTCPPEDSTTDGLLTSYETVLTEGPKEVDPWGPTKRPSLQDTMGGGREFVIVEWKMVSGNSYLYRAASASLASGTLVG